QGHSPVKAAIAAMDAQSSQSILVQTGKTLSPCHKQASSCTEEELACEEGCCGSIVSRVDALFELHHNLPWGLPYLVPTKIKVMSEDPPPKA
ncbi:MAG: hypothetical protein OIF54_03590, partial [Cohaesibacter sp.]|nr:hypothetical protein [Cohaesibacter sp.]